jgi:nucleotide-binding universal stress UspA family protein
MYEKILIANNGSEAASKALADALRLAQVHQSEVHMIYVEENVLTPQASGEKKTVDRKFAELLAQAEEEAKSYRVKLMSHLVVGRPGPAIVDFLVSRGGFDLLVIGLKGHTDLNHRILGKTADRLLEFAPCAVLVVK